MTTRNDCGCNHDLPLELSGANSISGRRGPGNFPGPVCSITEGHPLWMWCEVSYWFFQNGIVGEEVLQESRVVAGINSVLDMLHQYQHDPGLVNEVLNMFGEPALS